MEFGWTPEEEAHRARVCEVLDRMLPPDWEAISVHGPGSDAQTAFSREFCPALAKEGLLIPHWPAAFGGEDLPVWRQFILAEEVWAVGEPRGPQYMNVNWIGPVLMRYGTQRQLDKYLPPIQAGQAIWCQGFSEPSAGSDLAALRTSAAPVEGGYRVTGSKIWTSYAGKADTCFLLARVPPSSGGPEGKAGIVILLVDMTSPGIQVKPIPALIGEGDIHEVFFDDVVVPVGNRFGEEGQAWEIIAYSLKNERLGIPRYHLARAALERGVGMLKEAGDFSGEAVRIEAAKCAALCEAARNAIYAIVQKRVDGQPVGPESSSARFATVMAERAVSEFVVEYLPEALAGGSAYLQMHHQRGIVAGIASGAAEIQLNIIAGDVLGLPREIR